MDRYSPWIKAIQYVPTLDERIRESLKLTNMAADHLIERIEDDRTDTPEGIDQVQELMQISQHMSEPCLSPFYKDPAHAMKLVAVLAQRLANHHQADTVAGRNQDTYGVPDVESIPHEALSDLLLLVNVTRSPVQVAEWSREQRAAAYEWAAAVHLSASDNDVEVPERPEFLTDKEDES
jgi:hypothetical protein